MTFIMVAVYFSFIPMYSPATALPAARPKGGGAVWACTRIDEMTALTAGSACCQLYNRLDDASRIAASRPATRSMRRMRFGYADKILGK